LGELTTRYPSLTENRANVSIGAPVVLRLLVPEFGLQEYPHGFTQAPLPKHLGICSSGHAQRTHDVVHESLSLVTAWGLVVIGKVGDNDGNGGLEIPGMEAALEAEDERSQLQPVLEALSLFELDLSDEVARSKLLAPGSP
jgi:hypothetical protein